MKYAFCGDGLANFSLEANSDEEAIAAANAHYGEQAKDGRWVVRNEGENEDCEIVYVRFELEAPLYVLNFNPTSYREDQRFIGVFSSRQKAEERIESCITADRSIHPNSPARHQQKAIYYDIDPVFVDE